MRFSMSKQAQKFFGDIVNPEGSHGADNKNKFKYQFDVYYCCAMLGMAAIQLDESNVDLSELTANYPKPYIDYRTHIAGLLVATEAKRQGIDVQSPRLEKMMLRYLCDNETMLSEEGIKTLNAYALRGYQLIREFLSEQKPTSREEFLEAFNVALKMYQE